MKTGETLVTSLILALLAKQFLIQAFRIPSGSMEDTLLVGDFLFVNKVLYGPEIPFTKARLPGLRQPRAGDIIVFRPPHVDKDFIKRCVAVAGDTIVYANNVLFVNGERIDEPYKHLKTNPMGPAGYHRDYRGVVPRGHIFMMGDNRNNSSDSRFWGPLPLNRIKGKALTIYMSVDLGKWRVRFSRIGSIIR
ncbi:signal peptidase I [Candidatus Fermentibacteria bacterium]|nr:signal peptidase I [Candidatus Fermentibacteria bacterium]